MSIKLKLIVSVSTLVTIALVVLSVSVGIVTQKDVVNTLTSQIQHRLVGLRDAKKEQLTAYFDFINGQLLTLAKSEATRDAAIQFTNTFKQVGAQPDEGALSRYYRDEFGQVFAQRNGTSTDTRRLIGALDKPARYWQDKYIAQNTHPLGSKNALSGLQDGSSYDTVHRLHHPFFNAFLERFGYYDIFIVDAQSGHVVYSVFKELDYATSLLRGPYAQSGLGEVFRAARALSSGEVAFVDFAPYLPSYNAAASFVATPIVKDGDTLAVLVFQMPIDRLNDILTYQQNWQARGLGESGETYLVGSDFKMRSMSRFLLEDKAGYLQVLKNANVDPQTIAAIDRFDTSVGLQSVRTQAVEAALSGRSGFAIIKDYRNVAVASAYTYVEINGKTWALLSELDQSEAFADVEEITHQITTMAAIITAILIVIALFCAWLLGNIIATPIQKMSRFINRVATSLDLTQRFDESNSQDEMGQVERALNSMFETFADTLNQVNSSAETLSSQMGQLQANFAQLTNKSDTQTDLTVHIAAAMEQMAATSEDVAKNAQFTSEASHDAVSASEQGKSNVAKNMQSSRSLEQAMDLTMQQMTALQEQSNNISQVLEVIQTIAEQTNLLALNAAIEAARAGEQGRGFSVVADEVRSLAQRTQQSTEEINRMIQGLQSGSASAMSAIQEAHALTENNLSSTDSTRDSLQHINDQICKIEAFNEQMATAATEQSAVAKDVTQQISDITSLAQANCAIITQVNAMASAADEDARLLKQQISKFHL
ncbi:methyl-accepting chemotaxis protein [Pseudoalteromonas viridis]|uniref:Methyl-accepting chemotaxis protein n=1 Tax=Pseudoalteromonas viridis TaxID=339617 RepID=A0ABX7V150_9GAMM|nr:methyl-accepting chemotaxis protein [Pseudoalteromonas viridis]QTL34596.1 methyl-accepting chemotaxis protein [Pseudoalteromonas viridis]